jgi:hypothetical protein
MPDSSESLTRLLQWLAGILVGAGGLLGWAKHKLEREKQFVELGLITAQTEETKANVHKITVETLINSAQRLNADNDRLTRERDYWQARAEKAERKPLEEELDRLPEPPSDEKRN